MPELGPCGDGASAVHASQQFHEESAAALHARASPVEVQTYLGGIDYPAPLRALVARAQAKVAPARILATLEQLPDVVYRSVIDVTREVGRLSPGLANVVSLPSPALVLAHLKGISFPACKQEILRLAASKNPPPQVMEALEQIRDQTYTRIVDINKELRRAR